MIPFKVGLLGTISKFRKEIGRIEIQRKNRDHPDYSTIEIGQNTEKSP